MAGSLQLQVVAECRKLCIPDPHFHLAFGLSKIPKDQARLLPNKTLAIPGDEENYAVGLAVFHQLHCLVSSVPT